MLFVEPLKTAIFRAATNKVQVFVCFDSVILWFMEVISISWQGKRQRKQPSSLALTAFHRVLSRVLLPESSMFCPKNFIHFCNWGGCSPRRTPRFVRLWQNNFLRGIVITCDLIESSLHYAQPQESHVIWVPFPSMLNASSYLRSGTRRRARGAIGLFSRVFEFFKTSRM